MTYFGRRAAAPGGAPPRSQLSLLRLSPASTRCSRTAKAERRSSSAHRVSRDQRVGESRPARQISDSPVVLLSRSPVVLSGLCSLRLALRRFVASVLRPQSFVIAKKRPPTSVPYQLRPRLCLAPHATQMDLLPQ